MLSETEDDTDRFTDGDDDDEGDEGFEDDESLSSKQLQPVRTDAVHTAFLFPRAAISLAGYNSGWCTHTS